MSAASPFHPAVSAWFARSFPAPTAPQAEAWPAIKAGRHVLIAAPTGSGKTLAAFLAAIDDLVRQGLDGTLRDETQVVYVSPLKALSNDIKRNLEAPLAGIREELRAQGLPDVEIRTWVRTGDTPSGERVSMRRRPPHIVVTTPESLYVLLGSESGRAMLSTTRTVIVDEIHYAEADRAHRALSGRQRQSGCATAGMRDHRQRPPPRARSRARGSGFSARSRHVGGGVGAGLSAAGRSDPDAAHHAGVRQHAPSRRAGDPQALGPSR
jgi:ATP-dependent Lhr-like helicase